MINVVFYFAGLCTPVILFLVCRGIKFIVVPKWQAKVRQKKSAERFMEFVKAHNARMGLNED